MTRVSMPMDEFVWLVLACVAAGAALMVLAQRWWRNRD